MNLFTYREYWHRGQQYYAIYERTGADDALAKAVSDLGFAAQLVSDTAVPDRHNVIGQYAAACRAAAQNSKDPSARSAALDEAVAAFLAALQSAPEAAPETPFLYCDFAAALLERRRREPEDDLASAVNACHIALTLYARRGGGRPMPPDDDYGYFFTLLGEVHWLRYRRSVEDDAAPASGLGDDHEEGRGSELERAAVALRNAVAYLEPGSPTALGARLQRAAALLTSYSRSLRASELEEAIAEIEAVPGEPGDDDDGPTWAAAHRRNASLARALLLRNRLYDLDLIRNSPDPGRAEALASAVLRTDLRGHRAPPLDAWITALLARVDGWLGRLHRGRLPVEDEDGAGVHLPPENAARIADDAVKQMEAICPKLPAGFPLAAACYERFSTAYRERHLWADAGASGRDDAEAAVGAAEEALALAGPDEAPAIWRTLARARQAAAEVARKAGLPDLAAAHEQAAERAAEAASIRGREYDLEAALDAAVEWLDAAFVRRDWAGAGRASDLLERVIEKALAARRQDFAAWMRGLGQANVPPVIDLVTGQMSLSDFMSGHLRRSQAEFREVQVAHRGRGWLRRVQGCAAKAAYAHARLGDPTAAAVSLERGLARLFTTNLPSAYSVAAPLPAEEEPPLDATAIRAEAAADNRDLIYLVATIHGGMAVRMPANPAEPHETLWLDELTDALLDRLLYGTVERGWGVVLRPETRWDEVGWVRVYYGYKAYGDVERGADVLHRWLDAIDGTTSALWPALMGPLRDHLQAGREAVLIPSGKLRLLPLHAAWTVDPNARSGKRYAGDPDGGGVGPLAYAANAAALRRSRPHAATPADDALIVANPDAAGPAPLPFAEAERDLIAAFFPRSHALTDAPPVAVMVNLSAFTAAHFACHAVSDYHEPLNSGLFLAGRERLTAGELLAGRRQHRLIVLSACEAAVTGRSLPEELVGLADALSLSGAAGVIAPLWRILDDVAALLLTHFYYLWRRKGEPPRLALSHAQVWLRDTTTFEKDTWLANLAREWSAERDAGREKGPDADRDAALARLRVELLRFPRGEPAHAHPYYWAGFVYIGH